MVTQCNTVLRIVFCAFCMDSFEKNIRNMLKVHCISLCWDVHSWTSPLTPSLTNSPLCLQCNLHAQHHMPLSASLMEDHLRKVYLWKNAHEIKRCLCMSFTKVRKSCFHGAPCSVAQWTYISSLLHPENVSYDINKISIMTSSNENIFRFTGPLCREFTGHQWRGASTFSLICARING